MTKETLVNNHRIETERLKVVPFSAEYLTERYVSWLNDPDVMRFSDQRFKHHTLESCREYWLSFEGSDNGFWAIVAKDSKLGHIGNITTYRDAVHSVADISIMIGEKAVWGRGYGSESFSAMCKYLFDLCGIRKVTAGTLAVNHSMLGIMRKVGMIDDGRRIRQCIYGNVEVDIVHGALFKS